MGTGTWRVVRGLAAATTVAVGAYSVARWYFSQPEVGLSLWHYDQMAEFEREGATGGGGEPPQANEEKELDDGLGPNPSVVGLGAVGWRLKHWVAEVRVEFPARQNRPSDRAAMSKWLAGKLRERGWRVAHIADFVPRVVALACNQSHAEVIAAMEASAAVVRSAGQRWMHRTRFRLFGGGAEAEVFGC